MIELRHAVANIAVEDLAMANELSILRTREEREARINWLIGPGVVPFDRRAFDAEYPKNTDGAFHEAYEAGVLTSESGAKLIVQKGLIPSPEREGNHLKWSKQDIDNLISYLEQNRKFTPEGWAAEMLHYRLGDMDRAIMAVTSNPDERNIAIEIVGPFLPGLGMLCTVKARLLTPEEIRQAEVIANVKRAEIEQIAQQTQMSERERLKAEIREELLKEMGLKKEGK